MPQEINLKSFAAADQLRVETEPFELAVGIAADQLPPRPDLNGYRLKYPGAPEIYLVDQGYRRRVPDPTTY